MSEPQNLEPRPPNLSVDKNDATINVSTYGAVSKTENEFSEGAVTSPSHSLHSADRSPPRGSHPANLVGVLHEYNSSVDCLTLPGESPVDKIMVSVPTHRRSKSGSYVKVGIIRYPVEDEHGPVEPNLARDKWPREQRVLTFADEHGEELESTHFYSNGFLSTLRSTTANVFNYTAEHRKCVGFLVFVLLLSVVGIVAFVVFR